ncbi:MAG: ribosome biogenesis GTP-binding protein YihA/YsxC [Thermoanaerobacteraceae bacterium]
MKVKTVELKATAFNSSQYPKDDFLQIAIVGKSNVGKSSLINTILNRRNFARISSKPGKTRGINFYLINDKLYLVDLPGYGYAEVSKEMKKQWGKNIEEYLNKSTKLVHGLLLIDIRRVPSEDDIIMADWFRYKNIPYTVIATKVDKLKKTELEKSLEIFTKTLNIKKENIIKFSSLKKIGAEEVLSVFDEYAN